MFDPMNASFEADRQYEFVSQGIHTSRLLSQFAGERLRSYSSRLASVQSDIRASLSAWLCRARLSEPACS